MALPEALKALAEAHDRFNAAEQDEAAATRAVEDAIKARKGVAKRKQEAHQALLSARAACLEHV